MNQKFKNQNRLYLFLSKYYLWWICSGTTRDIWVLIIYKIWGCSFVLCYHRFFYSCSGTSGCFIILWNQTLLLLIINTNDWQKLISFMKFSTPWFPSTLNPSTSISWSYKITRNGIINIHSEQKYIIGTKEYIENNIIQLKIICI